MFIRNREPLTIFKKSPFAVFFNEDKWLLEFLAVSHQSKELQIIFEKSAFANYCYCCLKITVPLFP